MITCVIDYVIDPAKMDAFTRFARAWMALVERNGGQHHAAISVSTRTSPPPTAYARKVVAWSVMTAAS